MNPGLLASEFFMVLLLRQKVSKQAAKRSSEEIVATRTMKGGFILVTEMGPTLV